MTLRSHLLSSATPIDRQTYRAVTAACQVAEGYYRFAPGETADSDDAAGPAEDDAPCT